MAHKKSISELLNAGNKSDVPDSKGKTLLHYAAQCGDLDALIKMLELQPNVDVQDGNRCTPLHTAFIYKQVECAEVLIDQGAQCDVQGSGGMTPLHYALINGYDEALMKMLALKPDINAQDCYGCTILHVACIERKLGYVEMFLDYGARWDIADYNGLTVVFYLIYFSLLDNESPYNATTPLVKKLLERTKDGIVVDYKSGKTAAHMILDYNLYGDLDIESIKLVVSIQKDLNIEDSNGLTPLNYITEKPGIINGDTCGELIRFLIDSGAYLNQKDCLNIVKNPTLCDDLFRDVEFCMQAIINEFNYKSLPKFYSLLQSTTKIPSIEVLRMTLLHQIARVIRNDIKAEIERKDYCDVSTVVTTSLSKRCIEAYVSQRLLEISLQKKLLRSKKKYRSVTRGGGKKHRRRN